MTVAGRAAEAKYVQSHGFSYQVMKKDANLSVARLPGHVHSGLALWTARAGARHNGTHGLHVCRSSVQECAQAGGIRLCAGPASEIICSGVPCRWSAP
ncbi:hypothetical protein KL86DES1_20183 [uncultured Desulfovibrio sp.]|uniref:Uncharacterized protein n=1 Tax=uncultured Desulfovibrio sp. TaxID=167968 RepID=A0A212L2J7_9BACT|nr:hypothetical protein KL86DES1_20183 [uncultured Desulfovibrio sp.]VZH33083.1 conserved protein of unknown function [Desulfovibrio sp. 86]